jgi:uncharacterized protein (TIGR03435 family)
MEPGVFGVFRPVLLLPEGITGRLSRLQLQALLAHELMHVRRRDNLAAAVHMFVEALFWFHPLVWWIGARLVEERERACDEAVCAQGFEPEVYAEAILDVCKSYVESPLACAAGITGADLKKRIERIMMGHGAPKPHIGKKLLLGAASVAGVALPIIVGALHPLSIRAQATAARPSFEVASIKRYTGDGSGITFAFRPGGRLTVVNNELTNVIDNAYGIQYYQLLGGPDWINSDRYNMEAKAEGSPDRKQMMLMLQTLLEDRFQLKVHRETRELPVFVLTVAKGGLKMEPTVEGSCEPFDPNKALRRREPGEKILCGNNIIVRNGWNATAINMGGVTGALGALLRRKVIDKTAITGTFDVHLQWTPDEASDEAPAGLSVPGQPAPSNEDRLPSLFTALQEQLGLRLESSKGPVEVLVIDRVERPTEN